MDNFAISHMRHSLFPALCMALPDDIQYSSDHGQYPYPSPSLIPAVDAWPEYFHQQLLASAAATGSRPDPQGQATVTAAGYSVSQSTLAYWDAYGPDLSIFSPQISMGLTPSTPISSSLEPFSFPYPSSLSSRENAAAYAPTTAPRTVHDAVDQQQRDIAAWSQGISPAFGDSVRTSTSVANPIAKPVALLGVPGDLQRCRPIIGTPSYPAQHGLLPLTEDPPHIHGAAARYEPQTNMVVPPFFNHPPVVTIRSLALPIDPQLSIHDDSLGPSENPSHADARTSSSNISPPSWIVDHTPISAELVQIETALAMSDPSPPRTVVSEAYHSDVSDVPSLPSSTSPDNTPNLNNLQGLSQPPSNRCRVESAASDDSPRRRSPPTPAVEPPASGKSKRKMHFCESCNKSFDRPSTLKKHSVIHTSLKGESAHAALYPLINERAEYKCNFCGHLFNVQSNANRHTNRCKFGPGGPLSARDTMSTRSTNVAPEPESPSSTEPGPSNLGIASADEVTDENIPVSPPEVSTNKKRTRSETNAQSWIPASLAGFDLSGANCEPAEMPLRPVVPHKEKIDLSISDIADRLSGLRITHEPDGAYYIYEERNSFAQDVHPTPYHP